MEGGIAPDDQLIVTNKQGDTRHILLFPGMTVAALRRKVKGVDADDAQQIALNASESACEKYRALFKEVWPAREFKDAGAVEIGARKMRVRTICRVNDHYFRAIAKIAFHYYLTQTERASGREQGFEAIRRFIYKGGDEKRFFTARRWFVDIHEPLVPWWWLHGVGALEVSGRALGYVCLFKGPQSRGVEHHLDLGAYPYASVALPSRPAWAHGYQYDHPIPPTGTVGVVRKARLTRGPRRGA